MRGILSRNSIPCQVQHGPTLTSFWRNVKVDESFNNVDRSALIDSVSLISSSTSPKCVVCKCLCGTLLFQVLRTAAHVQGGALMSRSKMLSCIPLKKIKSCSVTVKAYSMALLKFVCFICAIEFQTEISGLVEARGFSLCDPECNVCSLCSEFLEQPHKIMYKQW